LPVLLAFSASYSVNGRLTPVPARDVERRLGPSTAEFAAAWATPAVVTARREDRSECGEDGHGERGPAASRILPLASSPAVCDEETIAKHAFP